jgi:hypothetical protein
MQPVVATEPVSWQSSLQNALGVYLPNLLGGLAILLVGWIVALILAAVTRKGLAALRVNERLNAQTQSTIDFQKIAGRVVFWAVLLLVAISMFGVLNVQGVTGPLSTLANTVMLYLLRLLMALLLVAIAWMLATVVRSLVNKGLAATKLDDKLAESADMQPLSATMGNVVHWLISRVGTEPHRQASLSRPVPRPLPSGRMVSGIEVAASVRPFTPPAATRAPAAPGAPASRRRAAGRLCDEKHPGR